MKENIPGTNTWNDRDDITTVIKQMIREYCEPHAKKFDHLDKMEKLLKDSNCQSHSTSLNLLFYPLSGAFYKEISV